MTIKNTSFFNQQAKERLQILFPENGNAKFDKINQFLAIAFDNIGKPLVVPPEIDIELHEVLSVRNKVGFGLEKLRLSHYAIDNGPETVGKSLFEIDSPIFADTINVLEKEGFNLDKKTVYAQVACILKVLDAWE